MSSFQIPRREVEASILLEGGETLTGRLFAPERGSHGEPGTLEGRLTDESEPFVPLVRDEGTVLVNAEWILTVTLARDAARLDDSAGSERFALTLRLAGGSQVEGTVYAALPAAQSRLLDFLNAAPRFLPVETDAGVVLVNRSFVVSVAEAG